MNGKASDEIHVFASKIGHEHPSHGPVNHVDSRDVPGSNGQIKLSAFDGLIKSNQVLGIVRKITIHFKNKIVVGSQSPAKAGDVSGSQTLLAGSLHQVQTAFIGALQGFNYRCGAIW
jgi:hypothetical protein